MLRLKGAQRNVEVWQRVLKLRGLVVTVQEDTEMWIKFANLCRKSNRMQLAYKTLATVYGQDPERPRDPVRNRSHAGARAGPGGDAHLPLAHALHVCRGLSRSSIGSPRSRTRTSSTFGRPTTAARPSSACSPSRRR